MRITRLMFFGFVLTFASIALTFLFSPIIATSGSSVAPLEPLVNMVANSYGPMALSQAFHILVIGESIGLAGIVAGLVITCLGLFSQDRK